MENRFKDSDEAGGEQDRSFNESKKSEKWRDRFINRFRGHFKAEQAEAVPREPQEQSVTAFEFVVGMFRRGEHSEPSRTQSWIDEAFDERDKEHQKNKASESDTEKLDKLDPQTRSEFYMIVAERFRQAGERFIRMGEGANSRQAELFEAERSIAEDQTIPAETAPPLFEPNRSASDVVSDDTVMGPRKHDATNLAPDPYGYAYGPSVSRTSEQVDAVKPSYIKNQTPVVVEHDGDVHRYIYKSRYRDSIFGERPVSRKKLKKTQRAFKKESEKQQKEIDVRFKKQQTAIDTIRADVKRTQVTTAADIESYYRPQQKLDTKETIQRAVARPTASGPAHISEVFPQIKPKSTSSSSKAEQSKKEFLEAFAKEREHIQKPDQAQVIEELSYADLKPAISPPKRDVKMEASLLTNQDGPELQTNVERFAESAQSPPSPERELKSSAPAGPTVRSDGFYQSGPSQPKPHATKPLINKTAPKSVQQSSRAQNQWMSVLVILVLIAFSVVYIAML